MLCRCYWYLYFKNRKLRLSEAMTVDYILDFDSKDLFIVYFIRTAKTDQAIIVIITLMCNYDYRKHLEYFPAPIGFQMNVFTRLN